MSLIPVWGFVFKILDFGIFLGTKIWQVFFGGQLDLSRDFFGYSKLMFLFFVLYHLMLSGNFYGSEIRHGMFLGLNIGPGVSLGFDFCPHSIIPVTWNLKYPPPFPSGIPVTFLFYRTLILQATSKSSG